MKLLNGKELAGYIKERQAKQVRALCQAWHTQPRLAIVQTKDDPVINSYISLKRRYSDDIQVTLDHRLIDQAEAQSTIESLNNDDTVHGIIVQLPLAEPNQTEQLVNLVAAAKDVDALGKASDFVPATPTAINWLLAGYNVGLEHKRLVIVGRGRLVGAPLERLWRESGLEPVMIDEATPEADFLQQLKAADVIVTATGVPGLITSEMITPGAVIVDAGVASEAGKLAGDVAPEVLERDDITMTPRKGGVGPLTVCALFDNVILSARRAVGASD